MDTSVIGWVGRVAFFVEGVDPMVPPTSLPCRMVKEVSNESCQLRCKSVRYFFQEPSRYVIGPGGLVWVDGFEQFTDPPRSYGKETRLL